MALPAIYDREHFDAEAFQAATGVSRETLRRFEAWRALLERRNGELNLVGRSTLSDFWRRHAYDGFQLIQSAPNGVRWLDIGSGAGIPGVSIALGLLDRAVPGGEVVMVESIAKKARVIEETVAVTDAPARVLSVRAESLDLTTRYDVVTARAVASLDRLFDYLHPFVENGAIALLPKGRAHEEELTAARKSWTFEVEVIPSLTAREAAILRIERLARVR
ncbi:MAG: 16S rRNA (guanine(527)-N(7))-methyltransferase RsmG [Pseudomonadota bacterium]